MNDVHTYNHAAHLLCVWCVKHHTSCAHTSCVIVDGASKVHNPEEGTVGGPGLVEVRVLAVLLGQLEEHAGISALGEGQEAGQRDVLTIMMTHDHHMAVIPTLGNLLSSSMRATKLSGLTAIMSRISWLSLNSMCVHTMFSLSYSACSSLKM